MWFERKTGPLHSKYNLVAEADKVVAATLKRDKSNYEIKAPKNPTLDQGEPPMNSFFPTTLSYMGALAYCGFVVSIETYDIVRKVILRRG